MELIAEHAHGTTSTGIMVLFVGIMFLTYVGVAHESLHKTVAALAGGAGTPKGAGTYAVLAIGLAATIAVSVFVTRTARRALREVTGE